MLYIESIRNAIENLILEKNLVMMGEDIGEPYGGAFKVTKGLSNKYPRNIIQTPMSEQGFVGMCIGIALSGGYSIAEIMFGDFITLSADQVINHAAKFHDMYMKDLHFVLRTPMGGYRGYGATHSQSLERLFLGIPGIKVYTPSIYHNPGQMLTKCINSGVPTLFVEYKLDYSEKVCDSGRVDDLFISEYVDKDNEIIRLQIEDEGPSITIITYGQISKMTLKAAKKIFLKYEIGVDMIVVGNLTPDIFNLNEYIRSDKVLIVEEGVMEYGYAAEVGYKLQSMGYIVKRIGTKKSFIPSSKRMEESVLPSIKDIESYILELDNIGR